MKSLIFVLILSLFFNIFTYVNPNKCHPDSCVHWPSYFGCSDLIMGERNWTKCLNCFAAYSTRSENVTPDIFNIFYNALNCCTHCNPWGYAEHLTPIAEAKVETQTSKIAALDERANNLASYLGLN